MFLFVSKIKRDKPAYTLFSSALKLHGTEIANTMKNVHKNTFNLLKQTDQKEIIETTYSNLEKGLDGEKEKPKQGLPTSNIA